MERDFERFRGGPNEDVAKRLYITLSPSNQILLNRNAYLRLGRPAAVHLYYSRERDAIGIEVTNPRIANAFPVMQNGPVGWRIRAAPFCRHFNISVEATAKFLDPEFDGNTLLLKLRQTVSVARPKRRKIKVTISNKRPSNAR